MKNFVFYALCLVVIIGGPMLGYRIQQQQAANDRMTEMSIQGLEKLHSDFEASQVPVLAPTGILKEVPDTLAQQMAADIEFTAGWGEDEQAVAAFVGNYELTSKTFTDEAFKQHVATVVMPRLKATLYQLYLANGRDVYKAMAEYLKLLQKDGKAMQQEMAASLSRA